MPKKVQSFKIHFDNPTAIYLPGQMVSGNVIIVLMEPLEMLRVQMTFCGRAYVANSKLKYELNYVDLKATVYGKQKVDEYPKTPNPIMPIGTHIFRFIFLLPPTCQASFEGKHGNIRYWVDAIIVLPIEADETTKRDFIVAPVLDLNLDPRFRLPAIGANEAELGFLCFVSGRVTCNVNLPKSGYVPGEVVIAAIRVQNRSNRHIRVTVHLLQDTVYIFTDKNTTHDQKVLLETLTGAGIVLGPSCNREWNQSWPLPILPPTAIDTDMIDRHYMVRCVAVPSGCSFPLIVSVPITIGTVPVPPVVKP